MNSELNGRPEKSAQSEAMFWRSMEESCPCSKKRELR